MACCVETLRHCVCVVTLFIALGVSVFGVASPWWRDLDATRFSRYEGLWQQCFRVGKHDRTCQFSQRSSGLWRATQVLEVTSLVLVLSAIVLLLVEIVCSPSSIESSRPRPRPHPLRRFPPPSCVVALLGGLLGLTGDLLYVGYSEYHTTAEPLEHLYYWSFALSVGGSGLILLAAVVMGVTAFVVLRKPKRHWSDHPFYYPERRAETTWRYFPGQPSYPGNPNVPFRPYIISDAFRRPYPPGYSSSDRRRPYSGDSYRSSRPYVVSEDSSYEMYRPSLYRESSRSLPSSRPGSYREASDPESYMYPDLDDLEMRVDYPSSEEVYGREIPSAPDSLRSRSVVVSSLEGSLPGYSSRRRERVEVEGEFELSPQISAPGGDPSNPDGPRAHPGPASSAEQQKSESSASRPSSDNGKQSGGTQRSEVTAVVSTQTHTPYPFPSDSATTSRSTSRSTFPLRHVQFEDESWGAASSQEVDTPENTFRPIRAPRDAGPERFRRYMPAQIPSRAREPRPEQTDYGGRWREEHEDGGSRRMEAVRITPALRGQQQAGSPHMENTDRAVFSRAMEPRRQRPVLKPPRQPVSRRPSPVPSNMPGHGWGSWSRRPGQNRAVRNSRNRAYDYYRFDEVF